MSDEEQNRFSARAARYMRVGTNVGAVAARIAGGRLFGLDQDQSKNAAELAAALGGLKGPIMKAAQLLSTIPEALPAEYARDPVRRERLTREARAAASLTHPSIATIYALEEFDGSLYLVSELVRGHTLREELAREVALLEPVADLVEHVVAHELPHRVPDRPLLVVEEGVDREEVERVDRLGLGRGRRHARHILRTPTARQGTVLTHVDARPYTD